MRKRPTPAQDALRNKISLLQADLSAFVLRRDLPCADGTEQGRIQKLRKEITLCEKELKSKENQAGHSKKNRDKVKSAIDRLRSKNPDDSQDLPSSTAGPGRRLLDYAQDGLLKAISDIAMYGASAEERRRCELVRTCRTLDDLHKALVEKGYNISRSATYLRLLPRRSDSHQGKRHVTTVPVKLSKPQADRHQAHSDQNFCVATIRTVQTIASLLGPENVFYLSQDDKCRVPLGLTAANKQAPIVMHMEYTVTLADHDFAIASGHKLIPSVYACCVIDDTRMGEPQAVTYSGPTYIAIRSAKHSSSTSCTHSSDFERLKTVPAFEKFLKDAKGDVKPIVIISTDGGPDENPRFSKVISHAVHKFKKNNLDALFLVTNAPGRSAFNQVERRMAPLSKEMAGLIIPHNVCGSHLRGQTTIDPVLEKKNFKEAGKILAEVWQNVIIDEHEVVAEYVDPTDNCSIPLEPTVDVWYLGHVRESRYMLQV